eukprot:365812-Chlamydomonas_euryale.AAC.1
MVASVQSHFDRHGLPVLHAKPLPRNRPSMREAHKPHAPTRRARHAGLQAVEEGKGGGAIRIGWAAGARQGFMKPGIASRRRQGWSESESQGAYPQRVCLCGANANRRNQRQQGTQQRLTQNKHGRGAASARRHKRRQA